LKEATIPDVKLPTEFDWRDRNVVTEVKNQVTFPLFGICEAYWLTKTGKCSGMHVMPLTSLVGDAVTIAENFKSVSSHLLFPRIINVITTCLTIQWIHMSSSKRI
jgi:hypothetical protein